MKQTKTTILQALLYQYAMMTNYYY